MLPNEQPEPYDSPLRWEVPSRTEGGAAYVVDLGANDGFGEYQCKHFMLVGLPKFRQGEIKRCWHLNQARIWFLDWAIKAFRNHDKNNETHAN